MVKLATLLGGVVMALAGAARDVAAEPISVLASEAAGRSVPVVFMPSRAGSDAPLVVRLVGLPGDGVLGAPAVRYAEAGYAVLEVDFGEATALPTPAMMRDILALRRRIGAEMADDVDANRIYVVPETHTLVADQAFFEHGGFAYRLDVIHRAGGPAPTAMQFSHRVEGRRENRAFVDHDDAMLDGLALRGFTVALADHHGADVPTRRVDRMPLLVDHGLAAIARLGTGAQAWNIDPERLVVVGFSKGGATAALLAGAQNTAELPPANGTPRVRATVVLAAYLDQAKLLEDGINPGSARWEDGLAAWGDPAERRGEWDRHSAITYVDAGDPPMLLGAGADDGYRPAQARRMAAALERVGVPHGVLIEPGLEHRLPASDAAWAAIFDFTEAALDAD